MTDFVTCYVEGKVYPRDSCHVHHRRPRHAGGGDEKENLVYLSANAHQLVHRVAQLCKSGQKGRADDLTMAAYPAPALRARFMEIVQEELRSSMMAELTGDVRDHVTVEVPVPREVYNRLKLKVQDVKTKSGAKMSIMDYVQKLIIAHVDRSSRK